MVIIVRGVEMTARSQQFPASAILPLSSVCTNWVEKKFFPLLASSPYRAEGVLTATIVDGRYIKLMIVDTLTAAASLVL